MENKARKIKKPKEKEKKKEKGKMKVKEKKMKEENGDPERKIKKKGFGAMLRYGPAVKAPQDSFAFWLLLVRSLICVHPGEKSGFPSFLAKWEKI